MRSLHWSVHPNGTLEVDVHGLDAVELRGVEDGAGGDDALGDAIRPRRALRASQRFPLRAKSSRQARGRPQYGSAFSRTIIPGFVVLIPLDCAQARALHDSPPVPQYPRLRSTNPPIFRASNVGGNIAVSPPKCPKWSILQWPCSEFLAPVGSSACQ